MCLSLATNQNAFEKPEFGIMLLPIIGIKLSLLCSWQLPGASRELPESVAGILKVIIGIELSLSCSRQLSQASRSFQKASRKSRNTKSNNWNRIVTSRRSRNTKSDNELSPSCSRQLPEASPEASRRIRNTKSDNVLPAASRSFPTASRKRPGSRQLLEAPGKLPGSFWKLCEVYSAKLVVTIAKLVVVTAEACCGYPW